MWQSPAGLTYVAFVSSARPTNAPPIPAGREPTLGGAKLQPANTRSGIWARRGEASTTSTAVVSARPANIELLGVCGLTDGAADNATLSSGPRGVNTRAARPRLEREAPLEVDPQDAFGAGEREAHRVLRLRHGEPEAAASRPVPALRGLSDEEDAPDVGQPEDAQLDRERPLVTDEPEA